jgi:alpha-L-rhamnosidase
MAGMSLPLHARDLHTELRTEPLGLDVRTPRLGWALDGGGRDARQSAWQIQVGTTPDAADCWDSGQTAGDAQLAIAYAGTALASRTRYHWRVRVWDAAGQAGPWSASTSFETAYLDPSEFPGAWLGANVAGDDERHPLAAARWLQPAQAHDQPFTAWSLPFELPANALVATAVIHVFAEGHDSPWSSGASRWLSVNGFRPDACEHLPRACAMTYDVSQWLKPGANHLAMRHFAYPNGAFIAVLAIDLVDGGRIRIPTTAAGPWRCRAAAKEPWDSGKGTVLWEDATASDWSAPIDAGSFGAGPWPATDRRNRIDRMIPALLLKRSFIVSKPVVRARIHATACGTYELALAGERVSDSALAPGWTDYRKRVHYQTYDVTARIRQGANELCATVGDGWWCGHLATPFGSDWYGFDKALKLALHLDYADGSSEVVATGDGWQAGTGAIRRADLMEGQVTDLTVATLWRNPVERPAPAGKLQAQPDEPVRRLLRLPVRSLTEQGPGRVVVDFGQNLVGYVEIRIRAPRGTRLTVRHAEVLDLKGEPWIENLRSALAVDEHVCSGGDDLFTPALTFHGFRYAEIGGLPAGITPEQITAVVIGSDTPDRGTFTCDNPLLNRLQANIRWGQRGNFVSIPTDCPQRDERLGWTADTQVFTRTAIHNTDAAAFYAKYIDDLLDAQHESGAFPDFAPTSGCPDKGRYGWADAGIVVPWTVWRCYGDTAAVDKAWAGMRRYLDQRDRTAVDDLNVDWSFGDWVSPPPQTPNDVLGPIYHAWMHRLMAEMAAGTGRTAEAAHHRARFAAVSAAWRAKHLTSDGRVHTSDTQAAYACALRAGVIPAELVAKAGSHLVRGVERHAWHLNTGFLGTYCLLPALSQAGRDDVAWRVLTSESFPGWLYTVKNGATTMWERWNTYSPETGPVNVGNMNSYNHYAFGAVGEWMYAAIGGLDRAEDDVAFQKLVIRPVPGGHCRQASCSYRGLRGTASSRWWIAMQRFELRVIVPPNCTADVHVPTALGAASVSQDGARHLRDTATHAVYAVGAGSWSFSTAV